ncbi:LOW QUALITY PROTEIN: DNA excision repair protein ERCC-6-like 2 [Ruditapes philippinarum]|uniref:LOW QUALITY PROTEIN: DNA excision repair protein ERCC-6-like 2 n=1 Tax=Ruditapes philippinarum TaxID=129788 RepID=UPI00295C2B77|nr:LOW QUALITY PROTEIN: DNA excision repair protein ERCC-6-like 2 [Ruditapes philippinarum]
MMSTDKKDSLVWSKGDPCLSPYSGDNDLYRGVIRKFKRSPGGDVLALVKFDGYGEDDIEEVKVELLEKVKTSTKVKEKACGRKKENSRAFTQGGMFSPLEGSEVSQRLKEKYDRDAEDEISVKSQKLSSVLFGKKSPGSSSCSTSGSGNKSRKPVVVTGGEQLKVNSKNKKLTDKSQFVEPDSPNVGRSRKQQLNITGGQAKNSDDELITSKILSDISSIVDSRKVKKALMRHSEHTMSSSDDESQPKFDKDINYMKSKEVNKRSDKHSERAMSSSDDENCGFNEEDMEKPRFIFKPDGVKVPLILSGDDEDNIVQVPGTLNQYLRDYQREGIKFLYSHYMENRGAILGDDMGLGKTVQVIGFLSALLDKQGNRVDVMRQKPRFIRKLSDSASVRRDTPSKGPFLIIGPGCVLYNWLEELETWGYFSVRKYHGSDKSECLKEIKKGKLEIVVTTFETFREHMADLNAIKWDAVIVDEVHKIKEMKAKTTKALREINTSRRFGLTGTALQNTLLEFWSILDWAQPDCLGSQADFVHEFVRPIESGQRHDANKRELATARKQKNKLAEIRKTMMIRRVKSLIADQLPKKDDSVVFCKLSQLQVSIYRTILEQPGMDYVIHGDDPCSCDSGEPQSKCCKQKTPEGQSIRSLRFTFMHLLLKTSNHVALLIPTQKTSERQATTARKICKAALKEHPEFVAQTKEASFKTLSDPKYCGKMKILQGLLKVFYKEHSKALVFSYSTQVLDIIEQHLMSTGYEFRRIDGSVSAKKRMIVVREFNMDPNIFICLISTKAGGLGVLKPYLGANKVVIFDPKLEPQQLTYQAQRQFGLLLEIGESCITRDIIKRNERVESALEGFETAQYVPPVVRVEEDEDYEELVAEGNTSPSLPSPASESEDIFAQFFSASDESDIEEHRNNLEGINSLELTDNTSRAMGCGNSKIEKKKKSFKNPEVSDVQEMDQGMDNRNKEKPRVRFQVSSKGKVKPSESRTGKAPLKANGKRSRTATMRDNDDDGNVLQYDQTLAGTFADVADVFDNCGVVHIHKNVKVVGGSRAEDHMSRCAISDVYEFNKNSQDLAAQCEPMSESSEEEEPQPQKKRRGQSAPVEDHNTARSVMIGNTKFLIGQTPKAFRLTAQKKRESKHTKVTPLSARIKKIGPGVSFLDEVIPDSESLSQKNEKSDNLRSNSDTVESSIEIGRKVSPRKRVHRSPNSKLVKKCKISSKGVHETVPQTYFEDFDNLLEERYKQERDADVEESADTEDLLDEIGRTVEHLDDSVNEGQVKRKKVAEKRNSAKNFSISSVLDDVFDGTYSSSRSRKPPPSKNIKTNSPVKRIGKVKEEKHEHLSSDDDDPFKLVDEIFSCNSNKRKQDKKSYEEGDITKRDINKRNNSVKAEYRKDNAEIDDDEVNLEDSTLKDDNYDCFDDPKLWKKRKREAPDKRNVVDRLIHGSDSDYNDLFTSGKLKKKEPKSSARNDRLNSDKSDLDGSASLF